MSYFRCTDKELGYSNFISEEWRGKWSLADDQKIVIKQGDKGSCVVVWDSWLSTWDWKEIEGWESLQICYI